MLAHIVGSIVVGWLLADIITGTFHWWEDRFGREDWPVIGPWIIAPNRLHHEKPLAFVAHGFWGRNRASIIASLIVASVALALVGPSLILFVTVLGSAVANEVHYFAHCPREAPAIVRVLQHTGLLQSPKEHAGHHRPPQNSNYCVLTDWLNPPLEALGVWSRLERALGRR